MKGKSIDKKKATPVILVQDKEEDMTSTALIGQMIKGGKQNTSGSKPSSNIFTGGFKYKPEDHSKVDNVSNVNPSQINKFTVYDEFGIINDSIGKKKYRELSNEPIQPSPVKVTSGQSSLRPQNPWSKPAQNNFVDPNHYHISTLPQRQQTATHVKSSLEVINLENIEAKLEAHRHSMKSIEQQYNISKGKLSVRPQTNSRPQLKFNLDIDKQYQATQPQQVYEFIKEKQDELSRPKEQVLLEQLWQEKKKKDPKLAEYDFKYQQFLVEKQAKKMIGGVLKSNLYTWDKYASQQDLEKRKAARMHKSKQKDYGEQVQQKILSKVYGDPSNSPTKEQQPNEQVGSGSFVDIKQKIASKDDKFIGKYIMAEIDVDKRGTISKDELADYLSTKDHLINGYHIDLKWLHTDLDNFQTKRKGMLDRNEVVQFLATLDSIHHPELKLKQINSQPLKKPVADAPKERSTKIYSVFFKQQESQFLKLFKLLDVNDDRIIKREEYIESIFLDTNCTKIMEQPAIKFNLIDKTISFRQIISFVLDDYKKQKNEKLKKSKEYITFQRFKQYFELPQNLDLNIFDKNKSDKIKKNKTSNQIDMFDIEEQYLLILKDIFDTIPRVYQNYIVSQDFVAIAMKDPQILALGDELCRVQSVETNLPVETILSTLSRMTTECDQYSTWQNIKTYFSRRGRPLDWDFSLIQKKKQIRKDKMKDGMEFAKSKLNSTLRYQPQQQIKRDPFSATTQSMATRGASRDKYTVPQPFNITDERKKSNLKTKELSTEQKQIQELKKKFKAKPVNKQILEANPDLIQGKLPKEQKSFVYNYENYQNDRIQRVLKKAQQQFELTQQLKEIKKMAQVKAGSIKIDLNKKLDDVIQQQKKNKSKIKPKPTVPQGPSNLYPGNPKQQGKEKLEKIKKNIEKQNQAEKLRDNLKKELKERAKEKNTQAKKHTEQMKRKEEDQKKERQKLTEDSHKPRINKYQPTEAQRQANRQNKQEREKKRQQQMEKIMDIENKKKQKRLEFEKKDKKLDIAGLEDDQILNRLDEVDFEDLLLDEADKMAFRKQYNFKDKTRKQIKERFKGLSQRQRADMDNEDRRLADQKKRLKEQKQGKVVQDKINAAREHKKQITTPLNMETQFHRSKALRRYRALMEGKEPPSEFDAYSNVGDIEKLEC